MKKLLLYLALAGVSGFVGYKIGYSRSKKVYEDLADKEVESVKIKLKEYYEKPKQNQEGPRVTASESKMAKSSIDNTPIDTDDIVKGPDYSAQYRTESKQGDRIVGSPKSDPIVLKRDGQEDRTKPYIIAPEDYAESNFETKTLWYLADKVLIDEDDNIISNVGIIGGYTVLDQIGLYEQDALHVRDEKLGIDYEIILDERTYKQLRPHGIHEVIDED